jgi:hypothetical protein
MARAENGNVQVIVSKDGVRSDRRRNLLCLALLDLCLGRLQGVIMDQSHLDRSLEVDPHCGCGLLRSEYLASQN